MTEENTRSRLKQALSNLDSLPAMPVIAQKILTLQLDSDAGENQLLKIIEQDPQIAAKIVGLANSPVLGITRKITTVPDAAMVLGITRIKSVAIAIASMANLSKLPPSNDFKPQDLWLHSMTMAIIMRTIALEMPKYLRPQEDHIFLAGLLHDIGFMALHHVDSAASNELHQQLRMQPERPIIDIELEVLGITHCHIGSQLGKTWHLPNEIVSVIEFHHQPELMDAAEKNIMVKLLHLVEKILPDFAIAEHTGAGIADHEWLALGIEPEKAEELLNLANEVAMQTAQMSGPM